MLIVHEWPSSTWQTLTLIQCTWPICCFCCGILVSEGITFVTASRISNAPMRPQASGTRATNNHITATVTFHDLICVCVCVFLLCKCNAFLDRIFLSSTWPWCWQGTQQEAIFGKCTTIFLFGRNASAKHYKNWRDKISVRNAKMIARLMIDITEWR